LTGDELVIKDIKGKMVPINDEFGYMLEASKERLSEDEL
jgi:hypothetical protein